MAKSVTQDIEDAPATVGEVARKWYVVLHNAVAGWWQGQTISDEHLEGHDVGRLLALGAIAEVGSQEHAIAAQDGLAELTPDNVPTSDPVPLPEPKPDVPAGIVLPSGTPATVATDAPKPSE